MSRIYPQLTDVQITQIPSAAEQIVYKALRDQLPEEWLVIHSLEFILTYKQSETHVDREADFVIFSPEYGVLVVEVKGGGISFNKKTDEWFSIDRKNNKHQIKNPLRQAKDAKYVIREHLQQSLKTKKILLGHAALFPDQRATDLSSLDGSDSPVAILGSAESVKDIKKWIVQIFNYWSGTDKTFDPLERTGIEVANRLYGKEVSLKPSLLVALERDSDKQIELTNRQKEILRQLRRTNRKIIEGGAGTGKTVLALDHAQQLASQGNQVLLLCYNDQLGHFIQQKCSGIENLHAMNYHQFCKSRLDQVKQETGRDLLAEAAHQFPGENVYNVHYPNALAESMTIFPSTYDAIIVDEGQDFSDSYWLSLELMADLNNAKFYIFLDTNQAIYTNGSFLPVKGDPLTLFQNCRNTKAIHAAAYHYYHGIEMDVPPIEGEATETVALGSSKAQADYIDKTVNSLVGQNGIDHSDVAVIVIGKFDEAKELLSHSSNHHLWSFQEFSPGKKVLVETARRFKGLEAKLLFLWILDAEDVSEKLLYVSLSRARLKLWVVGNEIAVKLLGKDSES